MRTSGKRFTALLFLFALFSFTIAGDNNPKNIWDVYTPIYNQNESLQWNNYSDSVLTVLGRWAWGSCNSIKADSNYAYVGNGPTLHVLDVSDPVNLQIVEEFER